MSRLRKVVYYVAVRPGSPVERPDGTVHARLVAEFRSQNL